MEAGRYVARIELSSKVIDSVERLKKVSFGCLASDGFTFLGRPCCMKCVMLLRGLWIIIENHHMGLYLGIFHFDYFGEMCSM